MTAHIAIVGAGPSGCFLAQALLKAMPNLNVDLIDSLPVPYGLVRYGVASDHQGTKAITRQFERLFERQGARFIGNMTIGRDISLAELRKAYDVVVLASGLAGDKSLGIPGADLAGVIGAGAFTRALYDHPDADALPEIKGNVVIMGNGNVAIDILRLLAKTPDELAGSDLGLIASDWLSNCEITSLTIVGRSSAAQAKFDPVMIRELGKLAGVQIKVEDTDIGTNHSEQKNLSALANIANLDSGDLPVSFRFGLTPIQIDGEDGHVTGVQFQTSDSVCISLPCDAFITAIGFQDAGLLNRDTLIDRAIDITSGRMEPGLYATGWFRRGPRGTIPENRADAKNLAALIVDEVQSLVSTKPGSSALAAKVETVDYDGWKKIDAAELAAPNKTRCRAKIETRSEMLNIARTKQEQI
ncbi:MAG: FAD-dependent oxidoreductase [Paracoccaceae bacterium]